ncbi:MAG: ATP-binding protein [Gammaproteobacteria bacterium]
MYKRMIYKEIVGRVSEPVSLIQVLAGPRQVGKTTLAEQVMATVNMPSHYASADEPTLKMAGWIEQEWKLAWGKCEREGVGLLVLDEIQKIPDWSTQVKKLWDADRRAKRSLHVILLGSSPLLLQMGLTESLAGRFEVIPVMHWSFEEMHDAFRFTVDQYIYFGGYPGAANLIHDEHRWHNYIVDSLIETTLSRDILLMARVDKPALLRQLFYLSCEYSGQILSYQKMQGQLQDAGNTTTLAHYLQLFQGAGMLLGLQKYAGQKVRRRGSSPKLQVYNTALITALLTDTSTIVREDGERWGRLVESSVGAHLINQAKCSRADIYYWREQDKEVDFVIEHGNTLIAIEVKSGRKNKPTSGLLAFVEQFHPDKIIVVGSEDMSIERFLKTNLSDWL